MTGKPQFDPGGIVHVYGLGETTQVDLITLKIEQPLGTEVADVDLTADFYVSATLQVGGAAAVAGIPWSITYYFTGFGGAGSGTLGNKTGLCTDQPAFLALHGVAKEYDSAFTQITVDHLALPPGLVQDQTYQITAVADFPILPNTDAFTIPTVMGTGP